MSAKDCFWKRKNILKDMNDPLKVGRPNTQDDTEESIKSYLTRKAYKSLKFEEIAVPMLPSD